MIFNKATLDKQARNAGFRPIGSGWDSADGFVWTSKSANSRRTIFAAECNGKLTFSLDASPCAQKMRLTIPPAPVKPQPARAATPVPAKPKKASAKHAAPKKATKKKATKKRAR